MNELLSTIKKVKFHNVEMFAVPLELTQSVLRWVDEKNPNHYNRNFFQSTTKVSDSDLDKIIAYQKEKRLRGFILKCEHSLDKKLIKKFDLKEERQFIFIQKGSGSWNINHDIVIHDCQIKDISEDLIDSVSCLSHNPQMRQFLRLAMEECLSAAKINPEYHWLAAYKNRKLVARCYAFCSDGLVQMEDLWVHPSYRHQHIATTLLQYINDNIGKSIFFHVEEGSRAIKFYENLGFAAIACVYEYQKEWAL